MKIATGVSLVNGVLMVGLTLLEHFAVLEFPLVISYQWHKILHLFGVSLFMVNMIIGPVWFFSAYYSKDIILLKFADRVLRLTDITITVSGLDLAILNGLCLASVFGGTAQVPWLETSVWLLVAMWILTLPLLYVQEKIYYLIEHEPQSRSRLKRWLTFWSVWGTVVMIPPTLVFYLMVVRQNFMF